MRHLWRSNVSRMLHCGACANPIDANPIIVSRPWEGWSSAACSEDCATTIVRRRLATSGGSPGAS